ncbi:MAG: nitroreductase family protein [Euryarchaeota archaeon]|nr:nitroreductase family protein [Euryarchaeota archaeon]
MKKTLFQKSMVLGISIIFCSLTMMPALSAAPLTEYPLPPPQHASMIVEESMFRRMSVRNYTTEPVTDQDLSTVLWAAYGLRADGNRTVPGMNEVFASIIYVLKEDAVYTYNPWNHSLVFYKEGDYRHIVGWQYNAPIQLGLVWDKNISSNQNYAAAELGEIGQNINFMADALNLGTVATGERPSPLENLGLPSNQIGLIIIPLGHPVKPYNFVNFPFWVSFLPRIQKSDMNLTTVLEKRQEKTSWENTTLSKQEQTQLVWSSYGYSNYYDKSDSDRNPVKRHRTVPSAHEYYPLLIYLVNKTGVYRYIPNTYNPLYGLLRDIWFLPVMTGLLKVTDGDKRSDVAQASESFVASAPIIIISVLDVKQTKKPYDDVSGEDFRWLWYYEAGASAHNVLLEATAWNLSGTIVQPTNLSALQSLLRLNEGQVPLILVPVGK